MYGNACVIQKLGAIKNKIKEMINTKTLVRINLPLFSIVVPTNICMFLSCRPFVVITTFSTGLVGNFNTHKTFENVVITTKGLQDRNIHILDGTTVENKGKTIN